MNKQSFSTNKKNIFLWTLYDFANSISVFVFFVYFSQWLVIDNKVADIWYNLIFVGSTILLLLTAPMFGSIADKRGVRMPFLSILTVLQFIALLVVCLIALFLPNSFAVAFWAALAFLLANYFYQFSFVFYNSLLSTIAPPKLQGFISGLGQSANWLGEVFAALISLPLVAGTIVLVGNSGRAQTFLPATILFFVLSLPMLLFFKEKTKVKKIKIDLISEYKLAIKRFVNLCKLPGMGRFLLGYFFFNDAMLTAVNNFPIYLEQVFKIPDKVKSMLLLGILITATIGALVVGWISDKVGLKKMLVLIIGSWIVIFPLTAAMTNFTYFTVLMIIIGFLFGATWTVTRAVMTYLSPANEQNHAFSYYTMFERFSTFVGPISWGLITYLLVNTGEFRYRVALASMAVFILIGLFIIRKIPAKLTY